MVRSRSDMSKYLYLLPVYIFFKFRAERLKLYEIDTAAKRGFEIKFDTDITEKASQIRKLRKNIYITFGCCLAAGRRAKEIRFGRAMTRQNWRRFRFNLFHLHRRILSH